MSTLPEQFSTATKETLDTQLAIMSTLANKAFESIEKMVELNLTTAKTSFEELSAAVQQAKDPKDFFGLAAAQAQPNAEKALAYTRSLASIFSVAQAEITKTAEAHVADTNRKVVALVEELSKNAPAGSDHAVSLLKSAIGTANSSYEQLNKSTKQTVQVLEANLNSAVNHISQSASKVSRPTKG